MMLRPVIRGATSKGSSPSLFGKTLQSSSRAAASSSSLLTGSETGGAPVAPGDSLAAVVPHMGESITDGTLANFLKKPGERVEADEAIAHIETDKVTIDIASPASGVIQEFLVKEGDTVETGTKVVIISKSEGAVAHVAPSQKVPETSDSRPSPPAEENQKPKVETTSVAEKPKVETTSVAEKPKAPSSPPPPKQSAKEPQLPLKERERRSAILGMHSIVSHPMVVGGSVVPRPMMYVALTYDHRLIDGREAMYFLRHVKDIVEDPQRLLLDI